MIITKYFMHCDTCAGVYIPPADSGTSAIRTRVAAREEAGWVLIDLLDLCPSCQLAWRSKKKAA